MDEAIKQDVNTNSAKFKEGVEAGLNSSEDTNNWQAGNELGQELKDEGDNTEQISEMLLLDASVPLFMRDAAGGSKGNDQNEKDETEE
ncbi:MAG: hypothetical protein M3447_08960 [Acidobacteriota bacterium]|nr:hypothetical protein [Acidobacteriota bacterium]